MGVVQDKNETKRRAERTVRTLSRQYHCPYFCVALRVFLRAALGVFLSLYFTYLKSRSERG